MAAIWLCTTSLTRASTPRDSHSRAISKQWPFVLAQPVRADGGYIVAPPSVHENGLRYVFEHEVDVLPVLPAALQALIAAHGRSRSPSDAGAEVEAGPGTADTGHVDAANGAGEAIPQDRPPDSVQYVFRSWFTTLGFNGASSHSGRRTFITRAARKVSKVGGSIRDVQLLAGHSSIGTTQAYIDGDPEAQRKLIALL
jgi:integrase